MKKKTIWSFKSFKPDVQQLTNKDENPKDHLSKVRELKFKFKFRELKKKTGNREDLFFETNKYVCNF